MKNSPLLVATILGSLLMVIGIAFFFSGKEPSETLPSSNQVADLNAGADKEAKSDLSETESTAEILGETSEESTEKPQIVIFSDFQCPACAYVEEQYIGAARVKYGDEIEVVFRHFPLESIHPYARLAAYSTEAARESADKFWEYGDLIYSKQAEWSQLKTIDAVRDKFIEYAVEMEIDKEIFTEKMESDVVKDRVESDLAMARNLRLNSTPTIYLNSSKVAPQELLSQLELLLVE